MSSFSTRPPRWRSSPWGASTSLEQRVFRAAGCWIVWRYSIQGLGFSTLGDGRRRAEMIARTAVAIVLVPDAGYFGAELANPAAWIAACIFLVPAYR